MKRSAGIKAYAVAGGVVSMLSPAVAYADPPPIPAASENAATWHHHIDADAVADSGDYVSGTASLDIEVTTAPVRHVATMSENPTIGGNVNWGWDTGYLTGGGHAESSNATIMVPGKNEWTDQLTHCDFYGSSGTCVMTGAVIVKTETFVVALAC
jgi:hypothetical protein